MPRRVTMPGADELFRSTAKHAPPTDAEPADAEEPANRAKHDEKMTVYLTTAELLAVEQARLELRGLLGSKVDRGKLVRAALALALDGLAADGADSAIAARLSES